MTRLETHQPIQVPVPRAPEPPEQPAASPDVLSEDLAPLARVEQLLESALHGFQLPANLLDACAYSLLGGGKRLRPLLTLHSGAAVGGSFDPCLPSAAAVEMIHAFSLVHDDLPALDNDDTRRGKPTLHRAHGEPMAILAGDGLMSMAFQLLAEQHSPELAGRLTLELARGTTGMIAGQVLDTLGGFAPALTPMQRVELVHRNKTGALIRASCRMGAIAAGASPEALHAVTMYGESVGLMFQVVDDLVDELQTSDHAGKRTGKDREAGKLTFPSIAGIEACRREVERLRIAARRSIESLGERAQPLHRICDFLAVRTK